MNLRLYESLPKAATYIKIMLTRSNLYDANYPLLQLVHTVYDFFEPYVNYQLSNKRKFKETI